MRFHGSLEEIIFFKHARNASRLSQSAVDLPPALDAVVVRLLDANPEQRPGAAEMLELLARDAPPVSAPVPLPLPKTSGPFVGRDRELDLLTAWFDGVRAGSPCIVHVRGASGVGKTELVQRFLARIPVNAGVVLGGAAIRRSRCPTSDGPLVDELSLVLLEASAPWCRRCSRNERARRLFPVLERVPARRHHGAGGPTLRAAGAALAGWARALLVQVAGRTPLVCVDRRRAVGRPR
jgi:hypothetical protein